jgi:hypothetical protein
VPELPPTLEWKPRVVKIERLKGFWDDYRELVASGHYKQGWCESISYGFASAILPSNGRRASSRSNGSRAFGMTLMY